MKIIATDYDGTLSRPKYGIIDKDREAIKKWRKAGNLFGVVTGRGSGMDRELDHNRVEYDFIIDFNGTEIWDGSGKLMKEFVGQGDKLYDMLPFMLNKKGDWADIVSKERSFYVTYNDEEESRETWVKQDKIKNVNNFMQIYSLRDKDSEALDIAAQLNGKFGDSVSALVNGSWLNIAPAGVTKSLGVMEYARMMNVSKENIYTIGDSYNDLDMIRTFNGFSVLNGSEEIKAAASKVYDGIWDLISDKLISQ